MKFGKEQIKTIKAAWENWLIIEFSTSDSDYLRYRLQRSMLSILRKNGYEYEKVVSYNVLQVEVAEIEKNNVKRTALYLTLQQGTSDRRGAIQMIFNEFIASDEK